VSGVCSEFFVPGVVGRKGGAVVLSAASPMGYRGEEPPALVLPAFPWQVGREARQAPRTEGKVLRVWAWGC